MKQTYDGREVNRIAAETVNDGSARGAYFVRKLIEFADGGRLYVTEKITAGQNIAFTAGDNALINYLFGTQNIEGKSVPCAAVVTAGTAAGARLEGTLSMKDGVITARIGKERGITATAVNLFIGGAAVAQITGLPGAADKNTLIITLNTEIS